MDQLVRRLAEGDREAFAELYDQCADRLHHYLTLRIGSREDASDVLQETFAKLARSRKQLAKVESLTAYIFTIARNEAARHVSRDARLPRELPDAEILFEEAVDGDLQQRESAEAIVQALGRLASQEREVVELKFYSELTFREIAEVTGVPQGTVATRYRTALKRLKGWLTKEVL